MKCSDWEFVEHGYLCCLIALKFAETWPNCLKVCRIYYFVSDKCVVELKTYCMTTDEKSSSSLFFYVLTDGKFESGCWKRDMLAFHLMELSCKIKGFV
jgi:hypothetical protein